jgi:hypothetical protein
MKLWQVGVGVYAVLYFLLAALNEVESVKLYPLPFVGISMLAETRASVAPMAKGWSSTSINESAYAPQSTETKPHCVSVPTNRFGTGSGSTAEGALR